MHTIEQETKKLDELFGELWDMRITPLTLSAQPEQRLYRCTISNLPRKKMNEYAYSGRASTPAAAVGFAMMVIEKEIAEKDVSAR